MSLPSAKKRKIFDGRYEVLSIVGRGLDSVVYHARHLSGGQQEVALKVLINNKPKSSITERLRKEALTLVSCRHRYVVRLDDFHSVADLCYLSMEYAPLGDLRKYISNRGQALSVEQGSEFLRQALEGMEFIHATGVLHRDLKPDNILVLSDKEIRLADFGLALLPGDELDLEELQNGVGSLAYLPPEMLEGQFYDSRSDLYSLGVCFYEALAGTHPFEGAHLSEQMNVRKDQSVKPLHEINPLIPKHLSLVIATLMRYSAEERFQTAIEALRALSNPDFSGTVTTAPFEPLEDDEFNPIPGTTQGDGTVSSLAEAPANNDQPDSFTDLFDDFFNDTDHTSQPPPKSAEPATSDTQEMTALKVQQLIEQDSKNKAAASARKEPLPEETSTKVPHNQDQPIPTSARTRAEDFSAPSSMRREKAKPPGVLATLFNMPPFIRTLSVGTGAALVTIALVLLSHVKPAKIFSTATTESDAASNQVESEPVESGKTAIFPNLPAGTYAGSIQGVLPGTTSPLALIVRPEQNTITVVVGIEGWTPTTISTGSDAQEDASTVVVRSNSVLLNMDGQLSNEEVVGTFSNAITGESGVWSAKKNS